MKVAEPIIDTIDSVLATYLTTNATTLIGLLTPIFNGMFVLWVAIYGYGLMYGREDASIRQGLNTILKFAFIVYFGLTVGKYTGDVVDFLYGSPEWLAAKITGSPSSSIATALDDFITRFTDITEAVWKKAGVMSGDFGMYFIGVLVMLNCLIVTVPVAFLIIVGKIGGTILLTLGPLFIICLLFKTTQRFFEAWLGQVITMGLILVLAATMGALILSLADSLVGTFVPVPEKITFTDVGIMGFINAICLLILMQVPSMAASLGGGVALSVQGAIGKALGMLPSAKSFRPTNIRRTARGIKRDYDLTKGAIKAPFRAGKGLHAAYQRKFGAGNSISQG